jgi:integrase
MVEAPAPIPKNRSADPVRSESEGQGAQTTVAAEPLDARPHPAATLADVHTRLLAAPRTRMNGDMRSALKAVGHAIGRPLSDIPAEPAALARLLATAAPAAVPLSPARWSRVKSLLNAALMEFGFGLMPGRDTGGYSPAWRKLMEGVTKKRLRIGLSRLMSFFRRACIEPDDVDEAAFERFKAALEGSLHATARAVYRSTVRLWNQAVDQVPGWPARQIALEPDPRLYSLPLENFPESFHVDFRAFLEDSGDRDFFSDHWAPSVRPATVTMRRRQIHQIASALVASGFPIERVEALATLTDPANAKAALSHLRARKGGKSTPYLGQQAQLLVTIARYWVRSDPQAETLKRYAQRLRVKRAGMVEKNERLLTQFDHPKNRDALLNLPWRVFDEVERTDGGGREEALRIMRALAVEILLVAPMRIGNLTMLELDRHLIANGHGKKRVWHIIIAPEDVKNDVPISHALPSDTAALLEIYLEKYRPRLNLDGGRFLFAGGREGCRATISMSGSISDFVRRETGLKMHVHLFRHLAVKLYLDVYPDDLETPRCFLGHRSSATTRRSYAPMQVQGAYRRWDAVVRALREGADPLTLATQPRPRGRR